MDKGLLLVLPLLLLRADDAGHHTAVAPPAPGEYYHGVFPGSADGSEASITEADVRNYEALAGSPATLICFSSEWSLSRLFPQATVSWIQRRGAIPYIRLMLRSSVRLREPERRFTLARIARGDFDADLRRWADGARAAGGPILAEYGTEVNGDWFPWNTVWNSPDAREEARGHGAPSGAALFVRAYRRIISVCRDAGASNISWVFHVNSTDAPSTPGNRLEEYYPGVEWIDWLGVSVYGAQSPADPAWPSFRSLMDGVYARLNALAPAKPVLIAEFGATDGHPRGDQAAWAEAAFRDLRDERWPGVAGFVWWNGSWENDGRPGNRTTMRLADNPALARAFRKALAGEHRIPVPSTDR